MKLYRYTAASLLLLKVGKAYGIGVTWARVRMYATAASTTAMRQNDRPEVFGVLPGWFKISGPGTTASQLLIMPALILTVMGGDGTVSVLVLSLIHI